LNFIFGARFFFYLLNDKFGDVIMTPNKMWTYWKKKLL